jgi:hypothetical protein
LDAADMETLPPTVALEPRCMTAVVSTSTRLRASEPAMPTVPESLAPEVASELKLCVVSEAPTVVIAASSVSVVAALRIEPAAALASFTTWTRLTVTATPIPTVSASVAEPSEVASESVFAELFSSILPPVEVTCTPPATDAREVESMMSIVTAAATVTDVLSPFSSVESAFGVADLPVP